MIKKCRCLRCIVFFLLLFPVYASAATPPAIPAKAAILLDVKTGQILYSKNMNARLAPASTTKILTAIIAIESGKLDDIVKVSARAAGTAGSSMHLYAGQIITLRELVTGLLLRSGNDAAVAIAEHLAGSSEEFVNIMNQKAQLIGAYNSQFKNPNGLSAQGHYSTAFDLASLARYALSNPTFAAIVNTKETTIEWLDRRGHGTDKPLRNTNKLLWMLSDADGVKTGTTNEAGPCLVSSATRGNQKLIAVVLHDHARWQSSLKLLQYGFDEYDLYEYANAGHLLCTVPVEEGTATLTDAIVAAPAAILVPTADYSYITVEVDLPEKIKAPLYRGQKIGEIVFFVKDKAVKTVDIVTDQDIEERTPTRIFFNKLTYIFRCLSGWGFI